MHAKLLQSCPTLCYLMDCSLPIFSVRGIVQARILEWVAISFSRGSSWSRNQTCVSCISCTAGRFFTTELWGKPQSNIAVNQLKMTGIDNISQNKFTGEEWKSKSIQCLQILEPCMCLTNKLTIEYMHHNTLWQILRTATLTFHFWLPQ